MNNEATVPAHVYSAIEEANSHDLFGLTDAYDLITAEEVSDLDDQLVWN